MAPYQQRVVTEEADLTAKVQALSAFLDGDTFKTLSENERRLLEEQYRYMVGYQLTLRQRIRLFEGT